MLPALSDPPGFEKLEIVAVAGKPPFRVKSIKPLVAGGSELASTDIWKTALPKHGAARRMEENIASLIILRALERPAVYKGRECGGRALRSINPYRDLNRSSRRE